MTDGSSEGYKYSRFRWRAGGCCGAAMQKLHARACWPPEERYLFPFRRFPSSSPAPDPRTFLTQFGRTIGRSVGLSSERSPSFRFTSVPCESPGTPPAILCRPRRGHNWPSYCTRPTRHVQITYTFIFYENSFLFILFFFLCFFSDLSHFALENNTATKTRATSLQRARNSLFPPRKNSISRCHTKSRSGRPILYSIGLYLALPSISRARVYRPLMLPPAGLLSPPLIRSTFAEITTTDAIFARPSSIYCIQYTLAWLTDSACMLFTRF
jgi:hypothetical protein